MEENTEQKQLTQQEIIEPFDKILGDHIERLLGTRYGIEALPLNISTVSCLIMIAARETEIESFPYLPPERYTNEKLTEAFEEISLETGEDFEIQLLDMIEKNYIKVADDGRFFANKSTKSMSLLLDRIFPRMPGLNLVAYLGQMMDEVQMGRKEMDMALDQFDQMLIMQGVPIKKGDVEKAQVEPQKEQPSKTKAVQKIYPSGKEPSPAISRPRSMTSQLETRMLETLDHQKEELPFDEIKPDMTGVKSTAIIESIEPPLAQDTDSASQADEASAKEVSPEIPDSFDPSPKESVKETNAPVEDPEAVKTREIERETESDDEEEEPLEDGGTSQVDDDDIEERITAFEQELGLKCPVCRVGGIKPEKTAKGKLYYHCSQKTCGFISWGKPYYLTCPKCNNPFLVETSNGAGETILKCPRATCHHWQRFPWDEENAETPTDEPETRSKRVVRRRPRRKVRRVVRRKTQ
ncbi:MAG: topoisomerase DNA-binding C4 zinc finger domain-containing protein [Deltaproteobacteria bacterium]|nr:topoisomerase DNA-binding C4 zinc finger domain-containing protein [Deltaproteobacteria bacterium]